MQKLTLLLLLSLVMFLAVVPTQAAEDSDSVEVKITPKLVSVLVSPASVNLGTAALGQETSSSEVVSATNNGSVTVNFDIKGSDAQYNSGGTTNTWTLSDTANGADQYMLEMSQNDWLTSKSLSASAYNDLDDGVAVGASENFKLKAKMPTSTTVYGEHVASVYVLAIEP